MDLRTGDFALPQHGLTFVHIAGLQANEQNSVHRLEPLC